MAKPLNVAILNWGSPSNSGVGELFLNAMVESYPSTVTRVALTPDVDAATRDRWRSGEALLLPMTMRPRPALATADFMRFNKRTSPGAADAAASYLADSDIELLWIVVNHPVVVPFALQLIGRVKMPYIAAAWDEVAYQCRLVRLDGKLRRRITADAQSLFDGAIGFSAISTQMRDKYLLNRPGTPSRVMRYVPPVELHQEPRCDLGRSDRSTQLLLAGSLYAVSEWNALVRAIGNSRTQGKELALTHVGSRMRGVHLPSWISTLDNRPIGEVSSLLNAADVGYLPYWRQGWKREYTRTAFPTKLASYVASGVPVLFHGPADCAAAQEVRDLRLGVVCDSNRAADPLAAIDQITEPEFVKRFRQARKNALDGPLDPRQLQRDFKWLVDKAFDAE